MNLPLDEGRLQLLLLALAELALERPGWEPAAIMPIVQDLGGAQAAEMFASLKASNSDRVAESRRPMMPGEASELEFLRWFFQGQAQAVRTDAGERFKEEKRLRLPHGY